MPTQHRGPEVRLVTNRVRRREIFFRTWSGGNSDGPEATRDDPEATLMVRMQQILNFREIDGPEATRDGLEATLMIRMQHTTKFP